ncbi:TIGR03089 family protein [Cellulomonas phragmiteti]|uniref:Acyl-CoA synthetase n=1 Tax=Cellulomonas phragmiteti TaxID=478780 RepID=A0ABQ4DJW3_9CELL|nr:TIGR03089 family protein [Cellulomonas phragmiteti]GIG39640.1 acyl-CoA synthetase [Cellulomonas phragmiteti]
MGTPTHRPPTDVSSLLELLQRDPGRPRITWYGTGGERVELSGAVLANWVSKSTNLLVEEVDAAPGVRVLLDLPPHWRALVWALASWRAGACVVLDADGAAPDGVPVDVVVTDRPAPATERAPLVVAVALPALARSFDAPLPPDVVDGAAVLSYADVVTWAPPTDPGSPALVTAGATVGHAGLVTDPGGPAVRAALVADDLPTLLRAALQVWAADGSVVLVDRTTADELRADPARRARVLGSEQVTDDRLTDAASPA